MASLDKLFAATDPIMPQRALHIDCKGVPPTPRRLVELAEIAASLRYTAVVMEFEDMFPWTVDSRFRCETAYTADDIRAFREKTAEVGIEVIPLVQCLGHMEFVLKFEEYAHLREIPTNIGCLNPLMDESRELVEALVDDVLALLPGVARFHLGGDEAWTFGSAPETKEFVGRQGKGALYLKHVGPILDTFARQGIRPMLWHDMMVQWDDDALKTMGEKADLVLWGYAGHPDRMSGAVNADVFKRFGQLGVNMWGATAYKGANGSNVDLPVFETRLSNALAWAEVAGKYGLKGVITTAWSRYMHLEVQCEPIDGALDSMAAHGFVLRDGRLPEGGYDACLAALEGIGQKIHFDRAHAALTELTKFRKFGWELVQLLREEYEVIQRDRRRRATAWMSFDQFKRHIARSESVARQVHDALAGSVDPLWVQRYLDSRIEPFRVEAAEIRRLLEQADRSFQG